MRRTLPLRQRPRPRLQLEDLLPQRPLRRPRPARSLALTGGAGRLAVHELTRGKELSIIPPTPGVKPAGTGGFSAGVSAGGGGHEVLQTRGLYPGLLRARKVGRQPARCHCGELSASEE